MTESHSPFESPKSDLEDLEASDNGRFFFRSSIGRKVVVIGAGLLALVHLSQVLQTYRVIEIYGILPGSRLWLGAMSEILKSAVSVLFSVVTIWLWSWGAALWTFTVSIIALLGYYYFSNPNFLFHWDVLGPWAILIVTLVFRKPFGELRSNAT